ncbi:methyltransferase [Flavihumibacter cheonanensis]|uniref:methyltransferase n=1 Tax=Flavihumibacter cheonanensis TaxID=1442385 RepID=UPI001EF8601D|nr:methyltransferase [Flavihumibacter cheonanensis]MCG7753199.1 SAM-dependent methyltransferase [Flavihumibacter cheonanensis]
MNHFSKDRLTAVEAKEAAQRVAFGPVMFQAAQAMRKNGLLQVIRDAGKAGITIEEAASRSGLSHYGARVLMEAGLGMGAFLLNEDKYTITKMGFFLLSDPLTNVNMNFIDDVCYDGLASLEESIATGKPVGLKVFGEWNTIYEALSKLPPQVQKSWFEFDHYYSDGSFPLVLPMVFATGVKKIIDIGGNTGKWSISCAQYAPDIYVTIMDLPGQVSMAQAKIRELGLEDRIHFHPVNILDENQQFPKGHDGIWMSQFLDCFSDAEITSILKRCYEAIDENGYVFILENFWDCQRFEGAAFSVQMTSLYFTALANGNSQMYDSKVFKKCIYDAGLRIEEQIDHIGEGGHTLLICRKA